MGRTDAARAALKTVEHLHPVFHEPVPHALAAAGLLDNDRVAPPVHAAARSTIADARTFTLTPIQAAAARHENEVLVKNVKARARRMGFTGWDDTKQIDVAALNAQIGHCAIAERLALKAVLASAPAHSGITKSTAFRLRSSPHRGTLGGVARSFWRATLASNRQDQHRYRHPSGMCMCLTRILSRAGTMPW